MTDMVLPRLLGTREAAVALVDAWKASNASEATAKVMARSVSLATPSFIHAFAEALTAQGVLSIELKGASAKFANDLAREVTTRGVSIATN